MKEGIVTDIKYNIKMGYIADETEYYFFSFKNNDTLLDLKVNDKVIFESKLGSHGYFVYNISKGV